MHKHPLRCILVFVLLWFSRGVEGQSGAVGQSLDSVIPVRGFCIDIPRPSGVDSFVRFIHEELAPRKVNTLFVLVDYHYSFKSHPELADTTALSNAEVKKIVRACAELHIRIIPQINMLGHQGWEEHPGKLLQVYPQFDETPWVKNPEHYVWPNADNLYCRSYCPLYPGIHDVLFTREMKPRFYGIVETTWSPTQAFLNSFYSIGPKRPEGQGQERGSAAQCFKDVFQRIDALGN